MFPEEVKSLYRVMYSDSREIEIIGFSCLRVCGSRAGRTAGRPEYIGTDHKVFFSVQDFSRAYESRPPFSFGIRGCGEGMAEPDYFFPWRIIPWGCMVSDFKVVDAASGLESEGAFVSVATVVVVVTSVVTVVVVVTIGVTSTTLFI